MTEEDKAIWQQRSRVHPKLYRLGHYLIILGGISLTETKLLYAVRSIPPKNVLIFNLENKSWEAKEAGNSKKAYW